MRMQRARRGSLLLSSLLMLTIVLALAIPQSMRTVSNMQLSRRFLNERQLTTFVEARMDEAIRDLYATPKFGDPNDPTVGPCPIALQPLWGVDPTWDCWTAGMTAMTGSANGFLGATTIAAQNVATWNNGVKRMTRKRIRVGETTIAPLVPQSAAYEILVDVQQPLIPGVGVKTRVQLTHGNGANPTLLQVGGVASYGQIVGNQPPVEIQANSTIQGIVRVAKPTGNSNPPSSLLCCSNNYSSLSSIALSPVSAGQWGEIDDYTGTTVLATNAGNIFDPSNPISPNWVSDGEVFSPDTVVTPTSCPATPPDVEVPSGTTNVFCLATDPDPLNQCTNKIGTASPIDGVPEYCMNSLWVHGGNGSVYGQAAFKADGTGHARVYLNGYMVYSSTKYALLTGAWAKVYGFKSGDNPYSLPANPADLWLDVPNANDPNALVHLGGTGTLYASIDAPNQTVEFGTNSTSDYINSLGPGYIIADTLMVMGGAEVTMAVAPPCNPPAPCPPPIDPNSVTAVRVIGWRRCHNTTCTQ